MVLILTVILLHTGPTGVLRNVVFVGAGVASCCLSTLFNISHLAGVNEVMVGVMAVHVRVVVQRLYVLYIAYCESSKEKEKVKLGLFRVFDVQEYSQGHG